jgi:hypothetical protein
MLWLVLRVTSGKCFCRDPGGAIHACRKPLWTRKNARAVIYLSIIEGTHLHKGGF